MEPGECVRGAVVLSIVVVVVMVIVMVMVIVVVMVVVVVAHDLWALIVARTGSARSFATRSVSEWELCDAGPGA
jgi:hypothetical protein